MIIAPSLLAADFSRLAKETERVNRSGAEWLHLDIMDGHFVQNISFGPALVSALRPHSKLFFDAHLMCGKPEILLEPFARAGVDQIVIHAELGDRVSDLIWKIKSLRKKVGLAINPPTGIGMAQRHLANIDLLLVMTVNPGFGGQSFIHETLPKVQQAREWRDEGRGKYRIQVDGGIDCTTAVECAQAGADTFVSGTTLFKQHNFTSAVRKLRAAALKGAARRAPHPAQSMSGQSF